MAIMLSCCCWRSVRRGSFACAIYSGLYFILLALTTGKTLQEESQYLKGNRSMPETSSILEHGTISPTTVRFNVALLVSSCFGVTCSLLLLYGLFKDQRVFLVPWILAVIANSFIDVAHSLYLFITASTFVPTKAMLYTLNFFLLSLNIYCLLCVISQYQEYAAGRGTAADDYEYRVSILRVPPRKEPRDKGKKVPAVRYITQPPTTTATSCLSSRKGTTNETKVTATPTQSPTAGQNTLSSEKSPIVSRPPRKHVQFPDTPSADEKEKTRCPIAVLECNKAPKNDIATPLSSLDPGGDGATTISPENSFRSDKSIQLRHT